MADYNIQRIRNALKEPIARTTEEVLYENLIIIEAEIQNYLIQFSLFKLRLEQVKFTTEQIYAMIGAEQEYSLNYSIFKQLKVYETGINQLLIDGYEIIQRLRAWITGSSISFSIGTQYYGKLYEGKFSLEEIIKKAKVGFSSKGILSLRLQMSKSAVAAKADQLGTSLQNTIDQGSTVFSHVFRYFYPSKAGSNPNKGNVYEVYRSIVASRSWPNPNKIPPEIDFSPEGNERDFFDARLRAVRSNTISGSKGGDTTHLINGTLIDEQDKFISSDPSLISISQIGNVLTSFYNSLINFGQGNFYQEMLNLFTKEDYRNKISDKLELQALNQTERELRSNINKIKLVLNYNI